MKKLSIILGILLFCSQAVFADGYVVFHSSNVGTSSAIYVINNEEDNITYSVGNTGTCVTGISLRISVPIKKGQRFQLNYTSSSGARLFFIYAEGAKND